MKTVCDWCESIIEVKEHYDPLQHQVFCSDGCRDAETVFQCWMSDDEINRRTHYDYLTKGEE